MEVRLDGKSAIVTGGSKGLGLAIAKEYAASGADVAILARDAATLADAKGEIQKGAKGKVAAIIGTATTNGEGGRSRHIDATATPVNINRGTLKLWFMAGNRKMIFAPAYHFAERETAVVLAQANEIKP